MQVVLTDCSLSMGKSMDSPSDRSLITDLSGVLFLSFTISIIPYYINTCSMRELMDSLMV